MTLSSFIIRERGKGFFSLLTRVFSEIKFRDPINNIRKSWSA